MRNDGSATFDTSPHNPVPRSRSAVWGDDTTRHVQPQSNSWGSWCTQLYGGGQRQLIDPNLTVARVNGVARCTVCPCTLCAAASCPGRARFPPARAHRSNLTAATPGRHFRKPGLPPCARSPSPSRRCGFPAARAAPGSFDEWTKQQTTLQRTSCATCLFFFWPMSPRHGPAFCVCLTWCRNKSRHQAIPSVHARRHTATVTGWDSNSVVVAGTLQVKRPAAQLLPSVRHETARSMTFGDTFETGLLERSTRAADR